MALDFQNLERAKDQRGENKKLLQKLARQKKFDLDQMFHREHEKVFREIDCLSCANCCKTTSPIFRDVDIKRIARKLRISEQKFIDLYLRMDEDRDYVLQQSPCAFLMSDNGCSIYEDRPLACREYPHTDRKNMHQILDLTVRNTMICPAVSTIVERIKESYEKNS